MKRPFGKTTAVPARGAGIRTTEECMSDTFIPEEKNVSCALTDD
jgi:hypothetical protein